MYRIEKKLDYDLTNIHRLADSDILLAIYIMGIWIAK